jgi:hypothetical protein
MTFSKRVLRVLAGLTLLFFTFETISWADPGVMEGKPSVLSLSAATLDLTSALHLQIPAQWGQVEDIYVAPQSTQLIYLIEEAHAHFESQLHEARLLNHLVESKGLSLVATEGASGEINTSLFRSFPVDSI